MLKSNREKVRILLRVSSDQSLEDNKDLELQRKIGLDYAKFNLKGTKNSLNNLEKKSIFNQTKGDELL